ncbi:MAG: hypothetical protein QNJ97_06755 [Myxococcota bacterium]|nr:hypothetical protein [Myxococcota bacterium]
MGEDKKKNKWVKSLNEAGLIDEVDDVWVLEDDRATITVAPKEEDPEANDDTETAAKQDVPFAVPVPTIEPPPPDGEGNGPFRLTSSEPPHSAHQNPVSADLPEHLPLTKTIPDTIDKALQRSTRDFANEPSEKNIEIEILDNENPPRGDIARPASFVNVRGKRISVSAESHTSEALASDEPILDEPPISDAAFTKSSSEAKSRVKIQHAVAEMKEFQEVGNYSGALASALEILQDDPENAEAIKCRDAVKEVLTEMYASRIGSFDRVPRVAISNQEIIWHNLDVGTAFILSRIDGLVTFEDILDISGMPKFDTCRILDQLLRDGIIE